MHIKEHLEGLEVYVEQQPEAVVEALLRAGLTNGQMSLATVPHLQIKVTNKGKPAVIAGTILAPYFCPLHYYDLGIKGTSGSPREKLTPAGVVITKRLLAAMPKNRAVDFTMVDVLIRAEDYVIIDLHDQTTFQLTTESGRIIEHHPALC